MSEQATGQEGERATRQSGAGTLIAPSAHHAGPPSLFRPAVPSPPRRPASPLVHFVTHHTLGALGGLVIVLMVLMAALAPILPIPDPEATSFLDILQAPSLAHPLGTDDFGRDQLSRLIYGAQTALLVGFSTAVLGATIGALLGTVSAYFGGKFDMGIQRLMDVVLSFPLIVLAIAVVSVLGGGILNLIIAMAVPMIPRAGRVVRSNALSVSQMPYIEAARCLGAGHGRIIFRHMLPNVVAPYLIMLTAFLGQAILLEASLSFLGLGVTEPKAAWGLMLKGAARYAEQAPWLAIAPGAAISLAVLGFNLLGDSLRDALDPRLRTL